MGHIGHDHSQTLLFSATLDSAVDVVIHYDPPEDHKTYLHRSGRAARAGRSGAVATFVLWDQHVDVDRLKKRLGLTEEPTVEVFSNDERLGDLAGCETEALVGAR